MKFVNIHYFALLRDCAGKESEQLEVSCHNYGELYTLLAEKYGFVLPATMIQVAVNDEFSSLDCAIEDAAKIVFIPPVSGG